MSEAALEDRPEQPPSPVRRRRRARTAGIVALMATTAVGLVVTTAWLNRRAVARQVLVGWLDQRGIPASVRVDRLELDGFVGRVIVGDARNPDFSGDVAVDYRIAAPWASGGMSVTPSRILLTRPVLKARWSDNKLSLGALDPLVKEFTGKPPTPDSRSPLIVVQQGQVRLATDYGPILATGDVTVDNGKLMRLKASASDLRLARDDMRVEGLSADLDLTTTGDRIALGLDLKVADLKTPTASGRDAQVSVVADLPYPDMKAQPGRASRAVDSRASMTLDLTGEALSLAGISTTAPSARLSFAGLTTGWIETFRIAGEVSGEARAARLSGDGLSATSPSVVLTGSRLDFGRRDQGDLRWSVQGPATLRAAQAAAGDLKFETLSVVTGPIAMGGHGAAMEASGPLNLTAASASFGDLALKGVTGAAALDYVQDGGTRIQLTGGLRSAGGRWPLFGPSASDDVPELGAMKAALGDFAVDIPAFSLSTGSYGTRAVLTRPARLTPRNGGVLTVQPVARPIYAADPGQLGGGALKLVATRGRGLPEAAFDIPDWRLTPAGFSARLDGRAALDFGIAQGLTVSTAGVLATDNGVLTYVASRCLDVAVERLELGENDVFDVAGQACPTGAPLATVRDGGWNADLALRDFAAKAPFLALDVDRIQGRAAVIGTKAGLGLSADIASARVVDTTTPQRFNPLIGSGAIALKDETWSGGFDLTSGQTRVAHLDISHNGLTERGGVAIQTGTLSFAQGGLQPADLTPLVDGLISPPVTGSIIFDGRIDWDPAIPEGSSSGRLTIPGLDFTSPAGPVKGLKGVIDFTSLTPLITAPNQSLKVDSLETVTPLTDLDLTFSLDAAALQVAGGEIQVAGGFVRIEPFSAPLDGASPFSGVIVFDRVQLGALVESAGLGDRVSLDAVVSGRLPFTYDPKTGISLSNGLLAAVQPGRLSIARDALTDLDAGGGGDIPPSTVEDLAYQAMEDLAFETLSASVDSEEGGKVRLRFGIKGRHDPPQRQELRVRIRDLISRQFLNRPMTLPSDTGINLNLNTSLNINQLISDLLEINRERNREDGAETPTGTPPVP